MQNAKRCKEKENRENERTGQGKLEGEENSNSKGVKDTKKGTFSTFSSPPCYWRD